MLKTALILADFAVVASAQAQPGQQDGNVHLDESSNGRTVRLARGQSLVVSLQERGSTGWSLTRLPTNLSLSGTDKLGNAPAVDLASNEPPILGAGTTESYWLRGEGAGRGVLTFERRSFGASGRRTGPVLRITVITN